MYLLLVILGGTAFGLVFSFIWNFFEKRFIFQKVKTEGDHILQEAQEKSEALLDRIRSNFERKKQDTFKVFDKEKEKYQANIQSLQSKLDKRHHQLTLKFKDQEKNKNIIKNQFNEIKRKKAARQKERDEINQEFQSIQNQFVKELQNHFKINTDDLKKELKKQMEENWLDKMLQQSEKYEDDQMQNLQKNALHHLNLSFNRFVRAYCPRRTIEPVQFRKINLFKKVLGPDNANIKEVEKECGVDMVINQEDMLVQIFGIDPVRRELGRMTLKNLIKKNKINSEIIKETVKTTKKELFKVIKKDGKTICRNLKLKNVNPEVSNMMGALKYRYSFAQNQFYHCEEVGWLCGLLNTEMGLSGHNGKRAGMFHDIGKAMDHSIEGSHAVIGADFISKYEEKDNITHAVRAHHHDETPSTALAHLVISADAISGSRPGARRFTEDAHSKKLASLERIIDSFDNIQDAYIMSAGREMRVIVNNEKVNDQEALNLSKKIAKQIEKECSYPGLIKVTVVRHSEAISIAK